MPFGGRVVAAAGVFETREERLAAAAAALPFVGSARGGDRWRRRLRAEGLTGGGGSFEGS